jgi:hypothetical protein
MESVLNYQIIKKENFSLYANVYVWLSQDYLGIIFR